MTALPRGRFVWYDLMTTDVDAAKAFYGQVVGWGAQPWPAPSPTPYTMWMIDGSPVGGVMALSDAARAGGAPPHWMAYVCVPDADATAEESVARGGKQVVPPFDIADVGRVAICADPQGAVFAAFTPIGKAPGHDGPAKRLEFSWHELSTTDVAAAFGFYSDIFGWEPAGEFDMGSMGVYRMFGRGGLPLGGMSAMLPGQPAPGWLYYAHVDDVHAGAAVATANGGQVVLAPMEVPGGDWIVVLTDPQGAMFALHHSKQP